MIRQNVAAVIVREEHVLLAAFGNAERPHYNFPGGGVEPGESVYDALRREVCEETGATVTDIGRLLLVWEYEPRQHGAVYGDVHKLCLMFECSIAEGRSPLTPARPDPQQLGAVWLPIDALGATPVVAPLAVPLLAALRSPTAGAPFVTSI